jgi:Leucine-rich repeat (LRR) protein
LPFYDQIFPDFPKEDSTTNQAKKANKFLRDFSFEIFNSLIIHFDEVDFTGEVSTDIEVMEKCLTADEVDSDDYNFFSACTYCQKCDQYIEKLSSEQKISQKYASNALVFVLHEGDQVKIEENSIDLKKSFADKFSELKMLSLFNGLVRIEEPQSVLNSFKSLVRLDFENNKIDSLPESIFNLKSVAQLSVAFNPIKHLPNSFQYFKNLKVLKLESLTLSELTDTLVLPKKLEGLTAKSLPFKSVLFDFTHCSSSLTSLELSGVSWINVEDYSKNSVFTLEQITFKFRIWLSEAQINKLFHTFDTKNKGYLNEEEMTKFNAFIYKRIPRLGSESTAGEKLKSGIPDVVFTLKNLTILNLSYQAIRFLPNEIKELSKLKELYLNFCIVMELVSPSVSDIETLDTLFLNGCISLKTPPPEIIKRGSTATLAYLKRLSTGSVLYKRTKLMLVGLGEAGKTSLVNSLTTKSNTHQRPTITDGIDIKDWIVQLPDKSDLTFSIWDFGSIFFNYT